MKHPRTTPLYTIQKTVAHSLIFDMILDMPELDLPFAPRYSFQAYHLTEILKLKEIDRLFSQTVITRTSTKLVYQEGESGYFFIYRFGSVVFFNIEPSRQTAIVEKIRTIIGVKEALVTSEELFIDVQKDGKNEVLFERVILDKLSFERVDVLALVLAQSTALEYFELTVDELLKKSGKITSDLRDKGRMRMSEKQINKFIGTCMLAKQDMVSSMYLLDTPDEAWNNEVLDALYRDASDMFELKERYKTMDHKLRVMQDNLEIIADLVQNRRATLLELTIILLILVEVVLFVYELWR